MSRLAATLGALLSTALALLSNRSKVMLKAGGEGTITWTSSDGSRTLNGPLVRGRDEP